jgi:serine/threonine protein kinase
VTETGPLPARPALWLAAGLARALRDIHDAGLTHGSLRPSNVLLSPDGPVVTDTGTGSTVITAAAGAEASPAADVLALGGVAFFAATGRVPYGGSPASTDRLPRTQDEPDLSGCPPGLLPVVRACLLPAPDRPSAAAMLARLEGIAGPMPRNWLPQAITARFADYLSFPAPPPASRPRRGWRARRSGLTSWLGGTR